MECKLDVSDLEKDNNERNWLPYVFSILFVIENCKYCFGLSEINMQLLYIHELNVIE